MKTLLNNKDFQALMERYEYRKMRFCGRLIPIVIEKVSNDYGCGYSITLDITVSGFGNEVKEGYWQAYYGHSKPEAIRKFKEILLRELKDEEDIPLF